MRVEGAMQEHLEKIVKLFCATGRGDEIPAGITTEEWGALCMAWQVGYQEGLRAAEDANGDEIVFVNYSGDDGDPEEWVEDGSQYCEFGEWG